MSHISKVEVKIDSLDLLKEACQRLGFEFRPNQRHYKWYGRWTGDTPLPDGIREEDLGKCDHAVHVPGCAYEIGVVKQGNYYILLWDDRHRGGLKKKTGEGAGILKQAYAVCRVRAQARLQSYRVREIKTPAGIRLVLSK